METNDLRELLEQVHAGRLSVDEALARAANAPMVNLGFATVDLHRRDRCGFPEVIFCQGKAVDWVAGVIQKLVEAKQDCLATRVTDEQAAALARDFPRAEQDRVARTFWLPACPPAPPV